MAELCEDPEEAEAWAAMRAAFADDEPVPGGGAEPEPVEPDDPEEAAAWRELQEAFGDAEKPPSKAGKAGKVGKGAGRGTPKGAAEGATTGPAPAMGAGAGGKGKNGKGKNGQATKGAAALRLAAAKEAEGAEALTSAGLVSPAWLQAQADRLTGEVQRRAGGPFAAELLNALWSLPLEEQHDVLLGAAGTEAGPLESKVDAAQRLWKLVGEEIRARGGWHTEGPARKPAGAAATAKRPIVAAAARNGPPARSRSRSRSPSI